MAKDVATVLVTGSTDGIGFEAAKKLVDSGVPVIVHGRRDEKVGDTVEALRSRSGGEVDGVLADLSRRRDVRAFAGELLRRENPPSVVVNNAGTYERERILTVDGLEKTLAVNYLAPFLLVGLLQDALIDSSPARVVNVSSVAHGQGRLDFENLQGERFYDAYDAYARSKLALIMFTYELAERLAGTGVTANALHPGVIDTKLLQAGFPGATGDNVATGAERLIHAALSDDLRGVSGRYLVRGRQQRSAPVTYDSRARRLLWEVSEKMTGLR